MKKLNKSPLAAAMGTIVLSSLGANVSADANPFALTELSVPYMQVAVDLNNKVNEAGCGANKNTATPSGHDKNAGGSCGEGKCGAMMSDGKMKKGMESSCGAMMKGKEGACGMAGGHQGDADKHDKAAEHSCGAMMKSEKPAEASCGAMMKGGEGSCGSAVDANKAAGK